MMPFFVPIYFGSHVGDVDIGALFILLGVIGLLTAAFSSCYDSYPSATLTSAFQFKEEVVPEEEKRLNRQQWRYAVPMILLFALTVVEYKVSDAICFFTCWETRAIVKETSLVEKHAH